MADSPFEIVEAVFVKEQKDTSPYRLERQEQRAIIRAARESVPAKRYPLPVSQAIIEAKIAIISGNKRLNKNDLGLLEWLA